MRLTRGRLAIVVAAGVAAALGAAYFFAGPLLTGRAAADQPTPTEADSAAVSPGPMYVLKERVVNLADPGGRKYLKVAMSVEFATDAAEFRRASPEQRQEKQAEFDKKIAPLVPLIDDAILTVLTARTSAELSTAEGKQRLKEEIKERLNRILGREQVTNVYFTQFVMQ